MGRDWILHKRLHSIQVLLARQLQEWGLGRFLPGFQAMFQTPVFPVISPSRLPFSQCFTYQAPVFPGSCLIWVATWISSFTRLPSGRAPPLGCHLAAIHPGCHSPPFPVCPEHSTAPIYLPQWYAILFPLHYTIYSLPHTTLQVTHCCPCSFTTLQTIHCRPCSLCHTTDHTNFAHVVFPNYPDNDDLKGHLVFYITLHYFYAWRATSYYSILNTTLQVTLTAYVVLQLHYRSYPPAHVVSP